MTANDADNLAAHFGPDEIECLIRTAAELFASTGDPADVLSQRQQETAQRAWDLMQGEQQPADG